MSIQLKVTPQQIIDCYLNDHLPATKVADKLNIGVVTVLKYLRLNNIPIRGSFKKNSTRIISRSIKLNIAELNRLYTIENLPCTEIAKRFNVSFTTITNNLNSHSIPICDSHDAKHRKTNIKMNELPSIIKNPQIICKVLTGEITCPTCGKTRRRQITRPIINEVIRNNGKCNLCIMKARAILLDMVTIKHLYLDKLFNIIAHGLQ